MKKAIIAAVMAMAMALTSCAHGYTRTYEDDGITIVNRMDHDVEVKGYFKGHPGLSITYVCPTGESEIKAQTKVIIGNCTIDEVSNSMVITIAEDGNVYVDEE